MATINPPPIPRLPKEWYNNVEIRAYQDAITRIIFQLWVNSPSGTIPDATDTAQSALVSTAYQRLFSEFDSPYVHTVSASSYTTIADEFVELTARCDVTLNPTPDDQEWVTIYINTAAAVGSTVTDGIEIDTFTAEGNVMIYRYHLDINEWVRGG